jgi:hypothetical protein
MRTEGIKKSSIRLYKKLDKRVVLNLQKNLLSSRRKIMYSLPS